MEERWAKIPGYGDRYEASDAGRIRWADDKKLIGTTVTRGYLHVGLYVDGKCYRVRVHRLVLMAFVGQPRDGQECRHLNGCRSDNRLSNLAWGTRVENRADSKRLGTLRGAHPGSRHHNAKIREEHVALIFRMRAEGFLQKEIADKVGIHKTNVSLILNGKAWRHINKDANARAEMKLL